MYFLYEVQYMKSYVKETMPSFHSVFFGTLSYNEDYKKF